MDSGFLKPGETLEDDYNVLRDLAPEEVVGIMDGLLSSEVGPSKSRVTFGSCGPGSMAHGSSSFADTIHLRLPGQVAGA